MCHTAYLCNQSICVCSSIAGCRTLSKNKLDTLTSSMHYSGSKQHWCSSFTSNSTHNTHIKTFRTTAKCGESKYSIRFGFTAIIESSSHCSPSEVGYDRWFGNKISLLDTNLLLIFYQSAIHFRAHQKKRLSVFCSVERYRCAHRLRSKFGPSGDHEK